MGLEFCLFFNNEGNPKNRSLTEDLLSEAPDAASQEYSRTSYIMTKASEKTAARSNFCLVPLSPASKSQNLHQLRTFLYHNDSSIRIHFIFNLEDPTYDKHRCRWRNVKWAPFSMAQRVMGSVANAQGEMGFVPDGTRWNRIRSGWCNMEWASFLMAQGKIGVVLDGKRELSIVLDGPT